MKSSNDARRPFTRPILASGAVVSLSALLLLLPHHAIELLTFGALLAGLGIAYGISKALMHPLFLCFLGLLIYFEVGMIIQGFEETDFRYPLVFATALLCMSVGGAAAVLFVPERATPTGEPVETKQLRREFALDTVALYALWTVGLAAYVYQVWQTGIPALSADPNIRYQIKGNANSICGAYWTIACTGLLLNARRLKTFELYAQTAIMTSASLFLLSLLLYRYAQLGMLLAMFIAYYYLFGASRRLFLGWGLLGAGLFFTIDPLRDYILSGTPVDVGYVLDTAERRLFLIGAQTMAFLFDYFPGTTPYLHGLTYVRVIRNLYRPEKPIPSMGYYIYTMLIPTTRAEAGYDPLSLPGEFYVNFGYQGFFLGMFVWGFVVQSFCALTLRNKNSYRVLILAVAGMYLARSFEYSLPGQVYNLLLLGSGVGILLLFRGVRK